MREQFASDNYSGICPEVMAYLEKANTGYAQSYGEDEWTQRATDLFRDIFEIDCEVFFVFNGTAANSLALGTLCRSYNSIVCHETAHVETDECGAPELFTHGSKLLLGKGENGKLTPESITPIVRHQTQRPALPQTQSHQPDAIDRAGHALFTRRTARYSYRGRPLSAQDPHGRRTVF